MQLSFLLLDIRYINRKIAKVFNILENMTETVRTICETFCCLQSLSIISNNNLIVLALLLHNLIEKFKAVLKLFAKKFHLKMLFFSWVYILMCKKDGFE